MTRTGTEVRFVDLAMRERLRVYWTCYWRAFLFVLLHLACVLPIGLLCMYPEGLWPKTYAGAVGRISTDLLASAVVGFLLVRAYARRIVRVRVGRVRIALIVDDAPLVPKLAATAPPADPRPLPA
jgi:hypothetical protein